MLHFVVIDHSYLIHHCKYHINKNNNSNSNDFEPHYAKTGARAAVRAAVHEAVIKNASSILPSKLIPTLHPLVD